MDNKTNVELGKTNLMDVIRRYRDEQNIPIEHTIFKKIMSIQKAISQDIGFQKSAVRNDPEQARLQDPKRGEFILKDREIVCWLYFNGIKYDRIAYQTTNILFIYNTINTL